MQSDAPQTLGPFRLQVDPDRAAAYAREIGADGAGVPLSYPALWLTDPTVFDVVRRLCDGLEVVPVHESQNFAYEAPLVSGEPYDVSVAMRREETPPRLILSARVTTPAGAPIATIETMLRLVPRAGFGSSA